MIVEEQLISKSYYKTFTEGTENVNPIRVLSDIFRVEQQKEVNDLSYIRFAQGEVYFRNKDFEAAIFKWESVSDEVLKPWAQKNIADAHYELDLLAIAEEDYKAIETDSDTLKTEVFMQLFSIYRELGKSGLALESINAAVDLNPDYPNVTDEARVFFEEQEDTENAVKLSVNEAIRTEILSWFEILEGYVEQRFTAKKAPNYFTDALRVLYDINQPRFESLVVALWNSYKQGDYYFAWLNEINQILWEKDLGNTHIWESLSRRYKDAYSQLLNGEFLIKDLSDIVPSLLTNWLKLSSPSNALTASTAVLAWDEKFPSSIDAATVSKAEKILSQFTQDDYAIKDVYELFESIMKWSKEKGLALGQRFEYIVRELLDVNNYNLMIASAEADGKSSFGNLLLDEEILQENTTATIFINDAEEREIQEIREDGIRSIPDADDFKRIVTEEQTFIRFNHPIPNLKDNRISLIDTPILTEQRKSRKGVFPYLHLADSLLFVLNIDVSLTYKDLEMAVKINEHSPGLPIHFIVCKTDKTTGAEDSAEITSRIHTYFPNANIFTFYPSDTSESQVTAATMFIRSIMDGSYLEEERKHRMLQFCRESIKLLLEKRTEVKDTLLDKIASNEDIVTKLSGTVNQLRDVEEENVQGAKGSYRRIKDTLKNNLLNRIPDLLKSCSELIKEDTDIDNIHGKINGEMNKRVNDYIEERALPSFRKTFKDWLVDRESAFQESQTYLKEMSESFNQLYDDEEKISLNCDFKVLDDWRRDVERITRNSMQVEKIDIIKHTPQVKVLMKSAGKFFDVLPKNKGMIQNKYKQYIKNKDYSMIAEQIISTFMQQFEFFEKSIERDINMFYENPLEVLNNEIDAKQKELKENHAALDLLHKKPEIYRDPLTLFELKVRQFEWLHLSDDKVAEYH